MSSARLIMSFCLVAICLPSLCEECAKPATAIVEEDFEQGLDRWTMTDPKAWKLGERGEGRVLSLISSSDYSPPVRSPLSIARLKDVEVTDFVLDLEAEQSGREYGHRDLCVFFGYQDPSHFYYAHIATKSDAHANSIFLVNDAPRVSIATERTDGTDWSTGYHKIRVTRCTESGAIAVYFDDMEKPIMRATDKTFLRGGIGVGSFDDVGNFDNLRLTCPKPCKAEEQHEGSDGK